MMESVSDYQKFRISPEGLVQEPGGIMLEKMDAIPVGDLHGVNVLDVGCDAGFWSFMAASEGAQSVVGLDRNRTIKGKKVDLVAENNRIARRHARLKNCRFLEQNIGKQWRLHGLFQRIFMFSVYHHIFENCMDHESIWLWARLQCWPGSILIYEGPLDDKDVVVQKNVSEDKRWMFTREKIVAAAEKYFDVEYVGPAKHEPHRHVFRLKAKAMTNPDTFTGRAKHGAGGASIAFMHGRGARMDAIRDILGFTPFPGSLNVDLDRNFEWGSGYFRADLMDWRNRSEGFDSPICIKKVRFYPVTVNDYHAYVMRFEKDDYAPNFVEIVADCKLRDVLADDMIILKKRGA